ncbi:rRNA maturation RNase YbeY [Terriglobus albidus]|uniref:Endoribonuclease YbeY n=2 Tax=Terriglobus albidus TaxID=1592106 RepID=A0A5B9E684_9BACT|nr:rRNA maturation RNase YbeY [Terriglobus albidus]
MIRIEPQEMPAAAEINRTRLSRYLLRARRAVCLEGQVDVLLTDDKTVKRLNRDFRGKNKATDVLSFPAGDFAEGIVGDLAVSLDTAAKQAKRFGLTLEDEIKTLLLHGLLHLAGYDHETDNGEMAAEEIRLRAKLRLPSSLIARVEGVRR